MKTGGAALQQQQVEGPTASRQEKSGRSKCRPRSGGAAWSVLLCRPQLDSSSRLSSSRQHGIVVVWLGVSAAAWLRCRNVELGGQWPWLGL